MLPYITNRLAAYLDRESRYFVNVTTGGFGVRATRDECDHQYLLGILNSRMMDWFFKSVSANFHSGYFGANKQYLVQLPICLADETNQSTCAKILQLAGSMLSLNSEQQAAKPPQEKELLRRQIDATDRQIDQLVYELYGLTDAEIAIVEGEQMAGESDGTE